YCYPCARDVHFSPTRRSSDLSGYQHPAPGRQSEPEHFGGSTGDPGEPGAGEQGGEDANDQCHLLHGGEGAAVLGRAAFSYVTGRDRKSTRLNSSHVSISYAVF